jgi:hypothetical protein
VDEDRERHEAHAKTVEPFFWALADDAVAIQEANARLARCFLSAWIGALWGWSDANMAAAQSLFEQAERQQREILRAWTLGGFADGGPGR